MISPLRWKSVRTRIAFWFMIVAFTPMLLGMWISHRHSISDVKGLTLTKLEAVRDLKVREVNKWLGVVSSHLHTISGAHAIRCLNSLDEQEKPARLDAIRDQLELYVSNHDEIRELAIVSNDGEVVVSTLPDSRFGKLSEDNIVSHSLETKSDVLADIHRSSRDQEPTMTAAEPLYCLKHDGKHVFGALVIRIDLDTSLYELLKDTTSLGKTGESLLIDRNMHALNRLRYDADAALSRTIYDKPASEGVAGRTGVIEALDYRGTPVLAAYTHIPQMEWGLVVKQDLEELNAPVEAMFWRVLILIVAAAIVIGAGGFFLASTFSRPVEAIAAAAGSIEHGDLAVRCEYKGGDELGRLSKAFNLMADSISSQMAIQQGVAEISDAMVAVTDCDRFAVVVLERLLAQTGSQLGGFYLRDQASDTFQCTHSLGLNSEAPREFEDGAEGQLGQATASGFISYVTRITPETRFVFKTVVGQVIPAEMVTIPLMVKKRAAAVIVMGALEPYQERHRSMLGQIQTAMSTALANLLASEQTQRMAEQLQASNEDLIASNEELQAQSEELQQQAEELREVAAELDSQRIQVQQADRLKSEFLSNMSHELRTPLNSVMALSQLMLARGTGYDIEEEGRYLKVIEKNGRQLLSLINDILDLSKIEAGRMDVHACRVDPRTIIQQATETIRPLAGDKGLELIVDVIDSPEMLTDEDKVLQILLNLMSNAVKFTDSGSVTLSVASAGGTLKFCVEDTGVGMEADVLDTIFEEFRQVDGSTTRKYEGTGLGLAICRKLATLLGGRIDVESEVGRGSKFSVTLPLECPNPSDIEHRAPAFVKAGMVRQGEKARPAVAAKILVVEDNAVAAMQIRSAMTETGHEVAVACDGVEAMEYCRQGAPDAIVLDLMMPRMDGFEVLRCLRESDATADVPVLVLTAKDLNAAERSELADRNVAQLVQKGALDRSQLVASIATLLAPAEPVVEAVTPGVPDRYDDTGAESLANKTVLIVEDNPDNQITVFAILDDIGLGCIMAEDGQQGVDIARKHRPDLILMDIQLPVLSGIDATRQIKADPALANIPIIALTAKAMRGDREEILAAGCDDYMAKPLDPALLGEKLRQWLCGRRATT